ncbi:MAG: AAA family ATPase, partial [Ignisphaera sp.]
MEIADQEEAKSKVLEWLNKWPNVPKKALLLYGPPGCGKTSLVEAIANEYGYELIEMNASDFRRKTDIERIALRASTSQSLFGFSRKIILLDEVDGISSKEDEGALEAVQELVEKTSVPIIMTANNPWDQNLRILR